MQQRRRSAWRLALLAVSVLVTTTVGPLESAGAFGVVPSGGSLAGWGGPHAGPLDVGSVVCGGLEVLDAHAELCSHGPDLAPGGVAGSRPGAPVPRRGLTCIGNGSSGQRVQVVYVHTSSANAPSSSRLGAVQRWVEQVEWTIGASAERFGGERRVRWVTDSSCRAKVATHRVSSASMNDFETMIDELRADGFTRTDRSYLLFVDTTRYCGIATAPRDDRVSNNRADSTAGYARVDRNCWDTGDEGYHSIAAHELVHTLGGVQASAPNSTKGAHCTDEHDLMCYDDGTGGSVKVRCKDSNSSTEGAGDLNDRLLDCGGNDYFHTSPSSGSYLATHWNVANSARLDGPRASTRSTSSAPSPTSDPVGFVLSMVP